MCDCCIEHMRNSQQQVLVAGVADIDAFARMEERLSALPGLLMSEFLPDRRQARITYDARVTGPDKIAPEIEAFGYEILK